ncbi:MAG: M48 family metallopeptidase [Treponema sp.]|nr:M48 family metallopeptidase [Treponema sp.]
MAFQQYEDFLNENTLVTGTAEAEMVRRVGDRIRLAAESLLAAEGHENYLDDYQWEYHLVQSNEVNAWVMPGGKIVIYTGILPLAGNEDGLAVIMGHEVAHAILNHGQQRMSASLLREIGRLGISIGASLLDLPSDTQRLILAAYGVGSHLGAILPFSRSHENEADYYGLILMTIAGYDQNAAVSFWERMAALGGGGLEWLSTHPSSENRAGQLQGWIPETREIADQIKLSISYVQ